ncbi:MAG: COX15/CtaA family protein [Sciscionella sp.]
MPLASVFYRPPAPPRAVQRAVGIAAVIAQSLIAVTGSVVRVTGSGLGCPTWPQCSGRSMVPVAHPELGQFHQWVEFGNRLLVVVVCVVAALCLITALLTRPHRRRYLWLAATMPLGVVAEAVIGGITVLMHLAWWTVCIHFLVSPVLVWFAVLFYRAVDEGDQQPRPLLARRLPQVASVLLALLLAAGTLVTAAGPHSGDVNTPRLQVPIPLLTLLHATLLVLFLASLVTIGLRLRATGSATLRRRYLVLIIMVLLQGALGVIQYYMGVPDFIVPFHILGAVLVTGGMASVWCAARDRGQAIATVAVPASGDSALTTA